LVEKSIPRFRIDQPGEGEEARKAVRGAYLRFPSLVPLSELTQRFMIAARFLA